MNERERKVVIIGGGPAGLTAAYRLSKAGVPNLVLEKDDCVGGISRTVEHKGFLFDIGGHRFFTKVGVVEDMWREVLGDDFIRRPRLSRIFYNKKFFHYPLRVWNALWGLGIWTSFLVFSSYVKAQLVRELPEKTFEQWVSNRFGKRLYQTFFKAYTEKVWGIPCSEISAEWAAQRIKGLSLFTALKHALLRKPSRREPKHDVIKTLVDSFHYPKRGPGMMWERVSRIVESEGGRVLRNADVVKLSWNGGAMEAVDVRRNGELETHAGSHFVSSMPVRELVHKLSPHPPAPVLRAADALKYRDFLTVALIVNKRDLFRDNWIYIHEPDVKVGRIQNFKNWSPAMVPDPEKTCLGLEYFCFEGDGLWTMPDDELVELARCELDQLGLAAAGDVEEGAVVRMPKAYPVYDASYRESLRVIRSFLDGIENLQLVGRNGMHKYNNQDHAMFTAMLAVENILGATHDLWRVNVDQDYHEEVTSQQQRELNELHALARTQPRVPERVE